MELISKEAVLDTIPKMICMQRSAGKTLFAEFIKEWIANIKSIPTIESRPKGEWIDNYSARNEEGFWKCSVCGREIFLYNSTEKERTEKYPYCNCGADMRGDEQ